VPPSSSRASRHGRSRGRCLGSSSPPIRRPTALLGWRVTTWLVLALVLLFLVLTLLYGLVRSLAGAAAGRPLGILAVLTIVSVLLVLLIWHQANQRLTKRFGIDEQTRGIRPWGMPC
jgi:hypothetical protein